MPNRFHKNKKATVVRAAYKPVAVALLSSLAAVGIDLASSTAAVDIVERLDEGTFWQAFYKSVKLASTASEMILCDTGQHHISYDH